MSDRYINLGGEMADLVMCRDCPVGNRWLVIDRTDIHDRWHASKENRSE